MVPLTGLARLAPLLLLLAPATPAQAIDVGGFEEDAAGAAALGVSDARGERNDLIVTAGRREVVVRERGPSAIRATGSCRLRSARVAVCAGLGAPDVNVALGGGDDRMTFRSRTGAEILEVDAGPGDDRVSLSGGGGLVVGGEGRDLLTGSATGDELAGGPGRDTLRGGGGDDQLDGDGWQHDGSSREGRPPQRRTIDTDVLDGGRGRDVASWAAHRRPVVVDLSAGTPAGARGERDRLRSIEGAIGGRAADRLLGDARANALYGGRGADTLRGRAGDDLLDAGSSRPGWSGEPDGAPDRLGCGPGRDRVADPGLDPLGRDCERIADLGYDELYGQTLRAQPRPAGPGRVRLHVIGPVDASARRTRARVILRAGGREIGRSRSTLLRDQHGTVLVRLRRPLPDRGLVRVIAVTTGSSFTYRLRR